MREGRRPLTRVDGALASGRVRDGAWELAIRLATSCRGRPSWTGRLIGAVVGRFLPFVDGEVSSSSEVGGIDFGLGVAERRERRDCWAYSLSTSYVEGPETVLKLPLD